MSITRRAAYRFTFTTGYTDLCPDCAAVLHREGEVAGDPREESVTLAGLIRSVPAPIGVPCVTCASLEAYEEALNASRVRSPTCTVRGECTPVAAYGGWVSAPLLTAPPEEHARWHAIHDTPTLAELEGEDLPVSY